MGKKVKQEKPAADQEAQAKTPKISPFEKYLPHHKYTLRRSRLQAAKKEQCIALIKLDKIQVKAAVESLKAFVAKTHNTKDLFKGTQEAFIYLEVDLSEVPTHHSVRPIQISLPTPIYSEKYNSRSAFFTADPEEDFNKRVDGLNLPMVSESIGYERTKKHYRDNREKLKLLNTNDLFFCDWKIYNLLRKPLGKLFYEKKRFPFPIDAEEVPAALKDKFPTYEAYLNDLMTHTYTMLGNGPVYTLKIGRFDMSNPELVKNIIRGAYRFLPYVLEDIDVSKVRQISIKGYNSPSLPIYNYISPEEVEFFQKYKKIITDKAKAGEQKAAGEKIAAEKTQSKPKGENKPKGESKAKVERKQKA